MLLSIAAVQESQTETGSFESTVLAEFIDGAGVSRGYSSTENNETSAVYFMHIQVLMFFFSAGVSSDR